MEYEIELPVLEQIENIEEYPECKQESLTTIIAIKCTDGIVPASDSQGTSSSTKNIEQ